MPGSKEQVFMDETIPLLEKRRLMKFLTGLMQPETLQQLMMGRINQVYLIV